MNNVGKYSNPYISERLGEGMSCRSLYATLNASRPRKTQDSLSPPPFPKKNLPEKRSKTKPRKTALRSPTPPESTLCHHLGDLMKMPQPSQAPGVFLNFEGVGFSD